MRVLFLTLYPEVAASPRYRVTQFMPYLQERGIECVVESALSDEEYQRALDGRMGNLRYHATEVLRRFVQVLTCGNYDVVVLQKALMTTYLRGFDWLLLKKSARLIFDIDDAVHLQAPVRLGLPWKFLEDPTQVSKLMRSAELVLAGNRWLADEVELLGGHAEYFPTVVDTAHYVPADEAGELYRVGWIGGASTCGQLSVVKDTLEALEHAQTVLVGANESLINIQHAEYRGWDAETELKEIQSFSVGLMPLDKTDWGRGKCALKALLYMACGVPCIATPFGPIADIIEHNVNGLLADSSSEWADALEQLRDPGERARLGLAGRKTVEQRFSLKAAAPRYAELLEGLVS